MESRTRIDHKGIHESYNAVRAIYWLQILGKQFDSPKEQQP